MPTEPATDPAQWARVAVNFAAAGEKITDETADEQVIDVSPTSGDASIAARPPLRRRGAVEHLSRFCDGNSRTFVAAGSDAAADWRGRGRAAAVRFSPRRRAAGKRGRRHSKFADLQGGSRRDSSVFRRAALWSRCALVHTGRPFRSGDARSGGPRIAVSVFRATCGLRGAATYGNRPALGGPNLPAAAPAGNADISLEEVEAAQHAIEEAVGLDDAARAGLIETYRKAAAELKEGADWQAKLIELETARTNAPQELAQWKQRTTEQEPTLPMPPADADLEALKTGLAEAESLLKEARDDQAVLDGEQRRRTQRREEARGQDEAAAKRLEELYGELGGLPPLDRADPQAKARRTLLMARRKSIAAERAAYAQELPMFEATRELLRLQLDDAVQAVNRAEKNVAAWKEAVDHSTRAAAEERLRKLADNGSRLAESWRRWLRKTNASRRLASARIVPRRNCSGSTRM
ncbi:MAG: hypothetical protein QM775_05755 [Pirellulales bacterium]